MRNALPAVVSLMFLAACSTAADDGTKDVVVPPGEAPPTTTPTPPAGEGTVACRFAVPKSVEGKAFRCGDLVVPENRDKAGSPKIKIHYIVFKGKEGGTPTIELNGGPGGSSEMVAQGLAIQTPFIMKEYGRFLESGDLILFDQRGTGRSEPRLGCPLLTSMDGDMITQCKDYFAKKNVDLTGYVTSESADDVHDLMVGLGLKKLNLHGISYGTRLALEILRRHPDDVGATIIDGVLPAQAKLLSDGSIYLDKIITSVFAQCAADAKCNQTYPNLDATLTQLKTKLDNDPFESKVMGLYDWYAFTGEWFQRLYGEGQAGHLPFAIHDYAKKTQAQYEADEAKMLEEEEAAWKEMDAELFAGPLGQEVEARVKSDPDFDEVMGDMPFGMYQSIVCSDHGQYESLSEALAENGKVRPELRDDDYLKQAFADCDAWPKRAKSADLFKAVASAKPVLLFGGELDPATPHAWAEQAASTLSSSQLVTMKAGGHGAMDECAVGLKLSFLQTPVPVDTKCTDTRKLEFFYAGPPSFHAKQRTITKDTLAARILHGHRLGGVSPRVLRGDRNRPTRSRR